MFTKKLFLDNQLIDLVRVRDGDYRLVVQLERKKEMEPSAYPAISMKEKR